LYVTELGFIVVVVGATTRAIVADGLVEHPASDKAHRARTDNHPFFTGSLFEELPGGVWPS
jgi:hypothetical protein